MPTQKKGCDDDEIVGLFSPQRRLFRKSKAAVLFRAKVSYRLMYILHESAMTPTHSSLGILNSLMRTFHLHREAANKQPVSFTVNYEEEITQELTEAKKRCSYEAERPS